MSIPITNGTGASSVAADAISGLQYQQIKVVGGQTGSTSVWGINPDGSAQVSVVGTLNVAGSVAAIITSTPGSVVAFQGGAPWAIAGSVAAFQGGTQITSLVSTVPSSVIVGASIFGLAPVNVTNTNVNVSGSVVSFQGTTPWAIAGSVAAFQAGTQITSLVSTVPSSVIVGASIFGQLPAGTAPIGSVATLQGTNPWVVTNVGSVIATNIGSVISVSKDSSVLSVPVGSTIAVLQAPSIVGTYTEDAAHSSTSKGFFVMGVRNDTVASVTSADNDYSPFTVGPVGEVMVAPAPISKWIQGTADLRVVQGASVTAIAAQGASIFTYIQSAQVANFGPSSVLVTFAGGLGSILGYTIAPAGGGSNIPFRPALKTGANSAFTASINGTASVLVSAQGFIAKE